MAITLGIRRVFASSPTDVFMSQREINTDTESYLTALRAALRQSLASPGLEMRDYETINTAVTSAETGHLIFSSLHTIGAA